MSIVYDMFGKTFAELTPEEKREYQKVLDARRSRGRKRAKRKAIYNEYRSGIFEDNFGKFYIDELTDDEFSKLYHEVQL